MASLDVTKPKLESGNGREVASPWINLMLKRFSSSALAMASVSMASVASSATTSLEKDFQNEQLCKTKGRATFLKLSDERGNGGFSLINTNSLPQRGYGRDYLEKVVPPF